MGWLGWDGCGGMGVEGWVRRWVWWDGQGRMCNEVDGMKRL